MEPIQAFSLLNLPWLPVLRKSGPDLIRPAEITSRLADDPVLAFDWQRADFDAAARELLIGLLSVACWQRVGDEREWEDWWHEPPDPAALDACFAPFREAFLLDGPGPRFMQDREELQGAPVPVAGLLIDTPGENALKKNTDLFVKRWRVEALSRAAAAMALYTLQDFAPAGGAGHRVSLRGGGPMVTLVLPDEEGAPKPLWHMLWLNTYWEEAWPEPAGAELPRIFPWLAPTRTSAVKGAVTTPAHVHPAQAYWGMPRRIRLDFTPEEDGRCDLTGEADVVMVRGYRTRPSGANYSAWRHPLTPYYKVKATEPEWLPLHPQPERMGYRHWIGTVVASEDGLRQPATIVGVAWDRLYELRHTHHRLWAAGYDMDNMKPRGFVESEVPLLRPAKALRDSGDYASGLQRLIGRAREIASLLGSAVRQALWDNEAPGSDKGDRQLAAERFWARTEAPFLDIVGTFVRALDRAEAAEQARAAEAEAVASWQQALARHALAVFDDLVPLDVAIEEQRVMERRIAARRRLVFGLRDPAAGSTGKTRAKGRKAA